MKMFLKYNSNICRVCLEEEGNVSLFDTKELKQQYHFCTLLEASPDDELPSTLCTKCFKCLKITYNFKTKAISSDNYLRKFLEALNKNFRNALTKEKSKKLDLDSGELNSLLSLGDKEKIHELEKQKYQEIIKKANKINNETIKSTDPKYSIEILEVNTTESVPVEEHQEGIMTEKCDNIIATDNINFQEIGVNMEVEDGNDEQMMYSVDMEGSFTEDVDVFSQTNDDEIDDEKETIKKPKRNRRRSTGFNKLPENNSCAECNKTFSSKPNLMRHILTHANIKPYRCTICGYSFTQNGSLKTHMLRHTGERPYACNVCNKTFTRRRVLVTHSRIHTGDKPYECQHCNEKFRIKETLARHYALVHNEGKLREYVCTLCDRVLSSKYALDMHIKLHKGEKHNTIECVICHKSFSNKYSLRNHSKTHQIIEKNYECKVCEEKFKTKTKYLIHIRTHDKPISQFICEVCHKVVTKKFQLTQHLLTHEDESNYNFSCRKCGKCFTIKENLMEHLRSHNDLIYKCETCDVGFNVKRDLKLHRVNFHKESVDDLNTCDYCGISFVTGVDLNNHISVKHDAIMVDCEECGKSFVSKSLYKEHVLTHEITELK